MSAPGIFQKAMEKLLHGISGVIVYIDDILVSNSTEADHLRSLEEVLERLQKANLRAKKSKCRFLVSSVSYLGYKLDEDGLHPLPEKSHTRCADPQKCFRVEVVPRVANLLC